MKQKNKPKTHELIQIPANDHYHFRTRSRNVNTKNEEKSSRSSSANKSSKSPPNTQNVSADTQTTNNSSKLKKSDQTSLTFCPHLHEIKKICNFDQIKRHANCSKLNDSQEDWICLNCFACCACANSMNKNMQEHFDETGHSNVLAYYDLSIWCHNCNTYVNNDLHDIMQFTPRNINMDLKIEQ